MQENTTQLEHQSKMKVQWIPFTHYALQKNVFSTQMLNQEATQPEDKSHK